MPQPEVWTRPSSPVRAQSTQDAIEERVLSRGGAMARYESTATRMTLIVAIVFGGPGCDPLEHGPFDPDAAAGRSAVDVTGTWNVYWTLSGAREHGPNPTIWRFLTEDGSPGKDGRVAMEAPCSGWILPKANVADIEGTITGNSISLATDAGTWTGVVSDETMTGAFAESRGSGTWRAVKTAAVVMCATYEVWGGATDLGCGSVAGYEPDLHGYTFLGSATATDTFSGEYPWYYVVTRGRNVALVDTIETSPGTYLGTESTGNAGAYWEIGGPPDGNGCAIGFGVAGGYARIAPATPPTSIRVHIAP